MTENDILASVVNECSNGEHFIQN